MYVEDNEDKIIRLAKRKAYGPCALYEGHFGWSEYWLGVVTIVIPACLAALLIWGPDHSARQTSNTVQYTCYTNDPKGNLNMGYSGYITIPGSQTFQADSTCSFSGQ